MSLDRAALAAAVAAQGAVVRVVVAGHQGSSPREDGAAMLVWEGGSAGTIGGGALEWAALARARGVLADGRAKLERVALGPAMGQCCGGAVTLAYERFDADGLAAVPEDGAFARAVSPAGEMPLAVRRSVAAARTGAHVPHRLAGGWLVEPVETPRAPVWLWGAGHVGRAVAAVLAPLPGLALTWIDTAADRFPDTLPEGVAAHVAADPAALVAAAPTDAEHLVMTFSHALDLAICHAVLGHGGRIGLIGSLTKRARFRARLAGLGHAPAAIGRIRCPIGDPALGKHPQAIAVGVAAALLSRKDVARQAEGTG